MLGYRHVSTCLARYATLVEVFDLNFIKKTQGFKAQGLRVFTVLAKDPHSVPSTHKVTHNYVLL